MKRRAFLTAATGFAVLAAGYFAVRRAAPPGSDAGRAAEAISTSEFEITRTMDEWRRILSEAEYSVLREEATERPYTSPLLKEKRRGIYACAGCALPLYSSETKFDSGTGWPSFYAALRGAVDTREDDSLFMTRTEVHCRRCGGHLGHIFVDGPPPTGKRHCINGVALDFKAT